jgi:hypothetical protein
MMRSPTVFVALFIMGASFLCVSTVSCIPEKVTTSEKGRTGMPTAVYDKGTPPEKWDVDPDTLPVYPGAKSYGRLGNYITPDSFDNVVSFYKNKLASAKISEKGGSDPSVLFKTGEFNLEISGEDDNTLIQFSKPGD